MSSISPVVISCHNDNMVGILHGSDVDANVGIVIIVGGPQYRVGSHRQFVLLARDFANVGFPVLRFDFRGMGDSSGAFREFEAVGDDIRAAIDCFYEQHRSLRHVVLFGLCDAASASLMYAHEDPRVLGLVLVNPWARTDAGEARAFLRHYYFSRFLQKSFWRKVFSGEFRIGDSFRDLARKVVRAGDSVGARNTTDESFLVRMRTGVENFTGKILLIISGRDLTAAEFLQETNKSRVWRRCLNRDTVMKETFPEADHTMSTRSHLDAASETIVRWLKSLS